MRVPIFVTVAVVRLRIIAEGLAALYQIQWRCFQLRLWPQGEDRGRAPGAADQRLGFRLLRAFLPNSPVFSKKFITPIQIRARRW